MVDWLVPLITALITVFSAVYTLVAWQMLKSIRARRQMRLEKLASGETALNLEARLRRLTELTQETASLSANLVPEIEEQVRTAREAQARAEHASQIASLNESQAEAVKTLLGGELETQLRNSTKRERWLQLGIGFALGIIASIVGSLIINGIS